MIFVRKKKENNNFWFSPPVRRIIYKRDDNKQIIYSFKSRPGLAAFSRVNKQADKILPQNSKENPESDSVSFNASMSRKFRSWRI